MSIKVFDFFSGCGGTSAGLMAAGLEIVFGLDFDTDAGQTFTTNFPNATFIPTDIRQFPASELDEMIEYHRQDGSRILFSGCAPCQPFSTQNGRRSKEDHRQDLLNEFARFVDRHRPDFVFCENVPGLQLFSTAKGPFQRFLRLLTRWEYLRKPWIIESQDYGVPQQRRRLVLVASRSGHLPDVPSPTHGPKANRRYSNVHDWISDLPPLEAGQVDPADSVHRAARLSEKNLTRIRATPPGGTRRSWPSELVLPCHQGDHTGHTDVYGRLRWRYPASAMTTRCVSLSNGRFGHPEQHRAITPREAACLQTFSRDFQFYGNQSSMARQIGNAVPVLLAKTFGEYFMSLAERS